MPVSIDEITTEIRDVALQIHAVQDRLEERDAVAAVYAAVDKVSRNYKELYDSLPESERIKMDRELGRRLTDIRRLTALLPRVGAQTSTPDRQVGGSSAVGERRITGVSWNAGRLAQIAPPPKLRVGGETEAWCGPCAALTDHHIVAMVGDEPKQVVCQACGGRHNYRTAPARRAPAEAPESGGRAGAGGSRVPDRKAEELKLLHREVYSSDQVKPFDVKSRYKVGEIIEHPEFGRGKVETVLRSSMLVRFAAGGLKSLMLS